MRKNFCSATQRLFQEIFFLNLANIFGFDPDIYFCNFWSLNVTFSENWTGIFKNFKFALKKYYLLINFIFPIPLRP